MRKRAGVIGMAAALALVLSGCSGVVKETGVFQPAQVQPPPSERGALQTTAAQPSGNTAAAPRSERRLSVPSR